MPAPQLPRPVLMELKRVKVAHARGRPVRVISRITGVPRKHARARLRAARLLPRNALRKVPEPLLSWRTIKRYRLAASLVPVLGERGTARYFEVTVRQLRRMVRRVRGLAGRC